jgi:formate dehydrogenase major subunit
MDLGKPRFEPREQPLPDLSPPAMTVNLDACISAHVAFEPAASIRSTTSSASLSRGEQAKIVFDMDDPMAFSTQCGMRRVVQACPIRRADARP